mgnify:CR=1 FL=1
MYTQGFTLVSKGDKLKFNVLGNKVKVLAVIGAGKMGSTIIRAVKKYSNVEIIATGRRDVTLHAAEKLGAKATRDNDYAVRNAEMVVLSVKPQHFPVVAKQVRKSSWEGKIVASIMAGIRIITLKSVIRNAEVYRAMPNINALVNKATTAIAREENLSKAKGKEAVEELFRCLGTVYWVPEEILDVWTSLAGSGPAFLAEIVDALVLGAVASGMPRDLAYKAILDVLEGTAKLLRKRPVHPAEIRDEVTTPAGTTIRGIMILESEGVKAALMKTIEESYRRSVQIGNEIDQYIRRQLGL